MIPPPTTFEVLQDRFVAGLDRRLTHLRGCLETLRTSAGDTVTLATLDDMMRGFHSLAGIGGTYGFPVITDVARLGEVACQSLDAPITAKDVVALGDVLDSLAMAASSAAAASSRRQDQRTNAAPSGP